jgi:hypothetical protein
MSETDRAPKIDSLLFRCFVVSISRTLKIDSLLFRCFVAFANRTEDRQLFVVYPGFQF